MEGGLNFSDIFRIIRRELWLIILSVIFVAILGAIYATQFTKPSYKAVSTMMLDVQIGPDTSDSSLPVDKARLLVNTVVEWMTSDEVFKDVIAKGKYINDKSEEILFDDIFTLGTIKSGFKISTNENSFYIYINYVSADEQLSIAMVNQISDSVLDTAEGFAGSFINAKTFRKIDYASAASRNATSIVTIIVAAVFIGLILGVALVVAREQIDNTYKTQAEIESSISYPVIGLIADDNREREARISGKKLKKTH